MTGAGGGPHPGLDPAAVPDVDAFLARLTRLDPAAVVRLRPADEGLVALWARVPFGPLVTRQVPGRLADDRTVGAGELLAVVRAGATELPDPRDRAWRWPLPSTPFRVVERVPAAEVHRIGRAAAETLRAASTGGVGGRPVGSRMLRDALLDHVPLVATGPDGVRVEVPQRLVQAILRMGFLPAAQADPTTPAGAVAVQVAAGWVGLAATFGSAWHVAAAAALRLDPVRR